MGRPRGFDPDTAVQTAMMLFWQHGYDRVSLDSLVGETGASRKGLYALWPDKQSLLIAALKSYRQIVGDQILGELEQEDAGLAELERFWDRFEHAARQPGWSGCLVMRTAGDRIAGEPLVTAEIRAYLDRLFGALERGLRGAREAREIAPEPPPHLRASQAYAAIFASSAIGSFEGFAPRVADLIAAGRAACGVAQIPPQRQAHRQPRRRRLSQRRR